MPSNNVNPVVFRRGLEANLPQNAEDGSFYITTDTGKIYYGNGTELVPLGGGGSGGGTAADISIVDAGGYFIAGNVEAALQQLGAAMSDLLARVEAIEAILAYDDSTGTLRLSDAEYDDTDGTLETDMTYDPATGELS